MVPDTDLLKRLIQDMTESLFVQGTAQNCINSLKKLILLKKFAIISEEYYDYHTDCVENALEELYNCNIDRNSVELGINFEPKSEDWMDSLTVRKDTNLATINSITEIVNDAYISNKAVKLFGIHTNEMIHARVRSYNGDAFAIDLLDNEENMYTISDSALVNEIIRGRKFTFDTTYGFISVECDTPIELGDILFALLQNKVHKLRYRLNFMSYSDIINMNKDISYETVDIYNITGITEWLRRDNLDLLGPNNVVVFMEVMNNDVSDISLLVVNRNTSKIELVVDDVKIQLDKFSSNTVQRLIVHTDENITGELVIPYEIGDTIVSEGAYLSYPFDIIEGNFVWTNNKEEDI